jgi:hypothetical protein
MLIAFCGLDTVVNRLGLAFIKKESIYRVLDCVIAQDIYLNTFLQRFNKSGRNSYTA